jgi:hypothetical protein
MEEGFATLIANNT